jgi:hypothetical protein
MAGSRWFLSADRAMRRGSQGANSRGGHVMEQGRLARLFGGPEPDLDSVGVGGSQSGLDGSDDDDVQ